MAGPKDKLRPERFPKETEVLRGRDVVVRLYADGPHDAEAEPEIVEHAFHLTNYDSMLLEEHFGGIAQLSSVLDSRTWTALVGFFAVGVLHTVDPGDDRESRRKDVPEDTRAELAEKVKQGIKAAADRLITADLGRYYMAVEAALAIAHGQTLEQAKKVCASRREQLAAGEEISAAARASVVREIEAARKRIEEAARKNGSEPGSRSEAASKTSGGSRQRKASS